MKTCPDKRKKKEPAQRSCACKEKENYNVVCATAEPRAKEICRQKDAEQRKKKWKEKKKRDEAELAKAAETLDALITSDPPPTETVVAWMPLSVELKELLESVP